MTLFELQAWLGHRSPRSTQYYAQITPNTLTKAYTDAGYFARNVRTIEVLIDRDAVARGAAAAGEPWQYFDLGHGYCTYTFFEQCPHRMACARCDFYTPEGLAARRSCWRPRPTSSACSPLIPLTDGEQASRVPPFPGPDHGGRPSRGSGGGTFPWLPGESQARV